MVEALNLIAEAAAAVGAAAVLVFFLGPRE
jgi:hypothetical protein